MEVDRSEIALQFHLQCLLYTKDTLSNTSLPYERKFSSLGYICMYQFLLPFLSYNTKGWFWLILVIMRPKRKQICEKIRKFEILQPKSGFLRKNLANLAYFCRLFWLSHIFPMKWLCDVWKINCTSAWTISFYVQLIIQGWTQLIRTAYHHPSSKDCKNEALSSCIQTMYTIILTASSTVLFLRNPAQRWRTPDHTCLAGCQLWYQCLRTRCCAFVYGRTIWIHRAMWFNKLLWITKKGLHPLVLYLMNTALPDTGAFQHVLAIELPQLYVYHSYPCSKIPSNKL
jgi:hypothetical protein